MEVRFEDVAKSRQLTSSVVRENYEIFEVLNTDPYVAENEWGINGFPNIPHVVDVDSFKFGLLGDLKAGRPILEAANVRILYVHGQEMSKGRWVPSRAYTPEGLTIPNVASDYEHQTGRAIDVILACRGPKFNQRPESRVRPVKDPNHRTLRANWGNVTSQGLSRVNGQTDVWMAVPTIGAANWKEWLDNHRGHGPHRTVPPVVQMPGEPWVEVTKPWQAVAGLIPSRVRVTKD